MLIFSCLLWVLFFGFQVFRRKRQFLLSLEQPYSYMAYSSSHYKPYKIGHFVVVKKREQCVLCG